MIKRTFESKGLDYASELTLANCQDLDKIIDWNILNGFNFFRITSGLAPWKTEYDWSDMKDIEQIKIYLHSVGVSNLKHIILESHHIQVFQCFDIDYTTMWFRTVSRI